MAITIDYEDIQYVLEEYGLTVTDYYIEFTDGIIYMYWITNLSNMERYIKETDGICLEVQVKGNWIQLMDLSLKSIDAPLINCRYSMNS